ncbi:hypothetical protein THAOC_33825, partial [Thalassiosira oceanica]
RWMGDELFSCLTLSDMHACSTS